MNPEVTQRAIDFMSGLFDRVFGQRFVARIDQPFKRKRVLRQVEDSADAAAQSLDRLLNATNLTPAQAEALLAALAPVGETLTLDAVADVGMPAERLLDRLEAVLRPPAADGAADLESAFTAAAFVTVQALTQVGPTFREWERLSFSDAFEFPRKIVAKLNEISQRLEELGLIAGLADAQYELLYRDYLLQRFHRVEAGTVRMTTNLNMDLRELFVMPALAPAAASVPEAVGDGETLLNLEAARKIYQRAANVMDEGEGAGGEPALDVLHESPRAAIIGAPGAGKSTLLEWLQLEVGDARVPFVLNGKQAIPALLRLRQLDPDALPAPDGILDAILPSKIYSGLAPKDWLKDRMAEGRVLFMVDGLDEVEPAKLDDQVLPWLGGLIERYPNCCYVISTRPVGRRTGAFAAMDFDQFEIMPFDDERKRAYCRHWATAVRLTQNEPDEEARIEGDREGDEIASSIKANQYVADLAQNPLMLSAVCLVRYFEGGELPRDRAILYKLCVEGLLHNWDQRRGIRSEFSLKEKLSVCREVAIAMQTAGLAEASAGDVLSIFESVLGDAKRGQDLFAYIRHRSGLLIERRSEIFAFSHLTFQEYLSAIALFTKNRIGQTIESILDLRKIANYHEVILLFCTTCDSSMTKFILRKLCAIRDDIDGVTSLIIDAGTISYPILEGDEVLEDLVVSRIANSIYHQDLGPFFNKKYASSFKDAFFERNSQHLLDASFSYFLHNRPLWLDEMLSQIGSYPSTVQWRFIYIWLQYQSDTVLGKIANTIMELNGSMLENDLMIYFYIVNKNGNYDDLFSSFIINRAKNPRIVHLFCINRTKSLPPRNIQHWNLLIFTIKNMISSRPYYFNDFLDVIHPAEYLRVWEAAGFPPNWEGPDKEPPA